MNHNIGPSNISTGTTYGNGEILLVRPDGSREAFEGTRLPKSAFVLGEIATKGVGVNPPRISRIATEAPASSQQVETDVPQYAAATDLHSPTRNAYAGPASRQMALDVAEAKNRSSANRKTYQ